MQDCQAEQNVSCGKGLFWFFRRGSAFLKVGLQLASIAHRVTTKLVGPLIGNGTSYEKDDADQNDEEVLQEKLQEKFSVENNGSVQQRKIENVTKITVIAGIRPLQEYEGSGSFLNTDDNEDEDDNEDDSDITDDKSVNNAKEDYSEIDKISITNFVNKKVAVIEPLEATPPMFARSRSLKQQTLPKYGENLAEKIPENQDMKTLENEHVYKSPVLSITPKITSTTTDSNLQGKMEEDNSKAVSPSNSISQDPATTSNPSLPRSPLPWIVSKWVPS